MEKFNDIHNIINEYITLMDKLIDFERSKLEAVQSKDNDLLNTFLKEEQVYLLQLRGLDQKRETTQRNLGIENLTYRDIISLAEGQEKENLQSSYDTLSIKTTEFKNLIETIKTHIEIKLHTIEATMEKFGGSSSADSNLGIYDKVSGQHNNQNSKSTFANTTGKFQSTKV